MASPSGGGGEGEAVSRSSTSPTRPPPEHGGATVQPSTAVPDSNSAEAADLAPTQASAPSLPPFEPLFTLLTNASTNTTVHPRVHYVFSDDDEAAILSAEQQQQQQYGEDAQQPRRALVVDLVPNAANDAWTVSCASSLNSVFAVTSTELSKQQSGSNGGGSSSGGGGNGTGTEGDSGNGGLMLRVEGVSREPVEIRPDASLPSSGSGSGAVGTEDVESLADEFRRRMGILKKVVGEGEKRTGLIQQKQQELEEHTRVAHEHQYEAAGAASASDGASPGDGQAPAQGMPVVEEQARQTP